MAEIEDALRGDHIFGMAFIRSRCTALSANVLKMITLLQQLGGNKYQQLQQPFLHITEKLEGILTSEPAVVGRAYIVTMEDLDRDDTELVGEKMANLGEICNRLGLITPRGFVITSAATRRFFSANNLNTEINRRLTSLDRGKLANIYAVSKAIEQLIIEAPLPSDLEEEIIQHYQRLNVDGKSEILVAMRSSALGEDSGRNSFAGMYRTRLHVEGKALIHTYKEIVAGKYRPRAMIYRLQKGLRHEDVIMCVGCMVMVDGVAGGVMYSRSPHDLRSSWIEITAASGLAEQVVKGQANTEHYIVERNSISNDLSGLSDTLSGEQTIGSTPMDRALLPAARQMELADIAVRLEEHFGTAQDIEWTLGRDGMMYILQSRPLAGLAISTESGVSGIKSDGVGSEVGVAEVHGGGDSAGGGSVSLGERWQGGTGQENLVVRCGVCVSPGVACGPVHIVRQEEDLLQFPKGAVLLVGHPSPEWAAVLPQTAAVIAETGQNAAHLATVAREFGVPAIFGATAAMSSLRNEQVVTVDATAMKVYLGRHEPLLAQALPPPKLMLNSPVFHLLRQAANLITPLNLLDPSSPYFRPQSCRTLHDITRFSHEKAVAEMFDFGRRIGFAEGAAKRLSGESPYSWWVIDLEDGFAPGHDQADQFIHIQHIASEPMLAIWKGMTAFPWQGPPPVNFKGLGSIIFRSTMNPNLDPAVRSNLNNRSYFLISKYFCHLSIRLGYHFAQVESHIADLLTENYVSFQFKGGAADTRRRYLRIQLIGEIVERYGFRVVLKEDTLTARLEKLEKGYLLQRLQILGYLLIHTRQIDMIMENPAMVGHYRQKIINDIEKMLTVDPADGERIKPGLPEVLIVDDEIEYLATIAERLRLRGFTVRTARCCQEAVQSISDCSPHVVVLDVMLPGEDGIACLRRIKAEWPHLGVIMLSGHASVLGGARGIEFGASDYCIKPVELDELVEKVHIAYAEATSLAKSEWK